MNIVILVQNANVYLSTLFFKRQVIATGLGFVAGYCDVIFLYRVGAFVGMQTGNVIFFGAYIGELKWLTSLFYATLITVNALGAGIFEAIEAQRLKNPLKTAALISLVLFAATELINYYGHGSQWQAVPMSIVMGLQNAIGLKPNSFLAINTSIVTSILHKIGGALYHRAFEGEISAHSFDFLILGSSVVIGTVCGAVTGGFIIQYAGLQKWWETIPAAVLQIALYICHDYCCQ
jgi:uncharacterized membrane protein YoaK (UPF0700 family)